MPRVTLVRHGQAAAGWSDDLDPGLSEIGRHQAELVADALASIGPQPIICSPMRRCRETSAALESRWGVRPVVAASVGEIVSPDDAAGLAARGAWLREAMAGAWSQLGAEHQRWRDAVLETIHGIQTDTVVHSHFIAINVVVGAATGDDRVVCFSPDNCSWTVLDVEGDDLRIVELGRQATTQVR